MATATPWSYRHRRPQRFEGIEINVGWSSGLRHGPDDVFSITLRNPARPDAHGCAELLTVDLSRKECERLHASLGRMLEEHPAPGVGPVERPGPTTLRERPPVANPGAAEVAVPAERRAPAWVARCRGCTWVSRAWGTEANALADADEHALCVIRAEASDEVRHASEIVQTIAPDGLAGFRRGRAEHVEHRIAEQRAWMAQCGGDLAGYIRVYGSKAEPGHAGDGGEAIYAADLAVLQRLEGQR